MAVWAILNGLDCRKCNKQIKEVRGCFGLKKPVVIEGIKVKKCPLKEVKGQSMAYLEAYRQYKNGFLPYGGGWLNQPLKFLEAMKVIEDAVEKISSEKKDA